MNEIPGLIKIFVVSLFGTLTLDLLGNQHRSFIKFYIELVETNDRPIITNFTDIISN